MLGRESGDEPMQIWRVDYGGGEVYPLTNDPNNYSGLGISSDNQVLVTLILNEVSSLYGFSPETKELTQLTPESPNLEGAAGLAQFRDGTIIFTRRNGRDKNLWAMDADGKNEKQLTNESGDNANPNVSPDGRYIVFFSNRAKTSSLWRMDADGRNPVQITAPASNEFDSNPQIMPDNKTVIFQRSNAGNNQISLFKTSIDGGEAIPINSDKSVQIWQPQLSPDGKHLAYMYFNPVNFEKKLQIARFDGQSLGVVENNFEYNLINLFKWSPDGKSLIYISGEGIPNLWRLPLGAGSPQQITNFKSGRIFNYDWSAEGKRLLITRGIVSNNLILIKDAALTSR